MNKWFIPGALVAIYLGYLGIKAAALPIAYVFYLWLLTCGNFVRC